MKIFYLALCIWWFESAICLADHIQREVSYWAQKDIVISILTPGSSHVTWVLEIGQELAARGHNVTFLAREDHLKYAKDYSGINVQSISEPIRTMNEDSWSALLKKKDTRIESMKMLLDMVNRNFPRDYKKHVEYIQNHAPDLFICDHLTDSCVRAAEMHKIPFILTSTTLTAPDVPASYINSYIVGEPTTENESMCTRIYNNYIYPAKVIWHLRKIIRESAQIRRKLGISSANQLIPEKINDVVKLVNNFYGFEPARPATPLVRFIGPVMQKTFQNLKVDHQHFLSNHRRIAYVAFGHHAIASHAEFEQVLTALIESVERGTIDGFIWAIVKRSLLPVSVTTQRGMQVNVTDIMENPEKYPHYLFPRWAPQFAILSHPSTAIFITHGGANSIFEGYFTGKKMLAHPYFADQPGNAKLLVSSGAGLDYDRRSLNASDIVHKIETIVEDENGKFAMNAKRMSALVQIKGSDAARNGASIVEEVLFTAISDKIPHMYLPSRNMSYLKAMNLDIKLMLLSSIVLLVAATHKLKTWMASSNQAQKLKYKKE
ncbi:hypothetical protein NQZ79_g3681 [Umbelopsis isabellina]|nr:hypothetical protein NQZ79_g3681 [Umbelopsis isabellina]